jgi:hypothetical protein
MNDAFPYHCLVTLDEAPSQLEFAHAAEAFVESSARLRATATPEGLALEAVWEPEWEVPFLRIKERFPQARMGRPSIKYKLGPPNLEPYLSVRIRVENPACLPDVLEDLWTRRAFSCEQVDNEASVLKAVVPAGELWGYVTVLRIASRRTGSLLSVEFAGYRPFPGSGSGGSLVPA